MEGFKEWLRQAWAEHPLYTLIFGAACFAVGMFLG